MSPARNPVRSSLGGRLAVLMLLCAACNTLHGAELYREGTRALERGEAAGAVLALEQAAVHVPRASEVQNHLGLAYQAAGRPDDALHAFQRAVELDCDNAAAQQNLRQAIAQRGRP